MGIRIDIDWEFISPFLQLAKGTVTVKNINYPKTINDRTLIRCKCKIERGARGFQSFTEDDGIPTNLFKIFEEQIEIMMRSFHSGMLLSEHDYHWVHESLEDHFDLDEWLKSKGA